MKVKEMRVKKMNASPQRRMTQIKIRRQTMMMVTRMRASWWMSWPSTTLPPLGSRVLPGDQGRRHRLGRRWSRERHAAIEVQPGPGARSSKATRRSHLTIQALVVHRSPRKRTGPRAEKRSSADQKKDQGGDDAPARMMSSSDAASRLIRSAEGSTRHRGEGRRRRRSVGAPGTLYKRGRLRWNARWSSSTRHRTG